VIEEAEADAGEAGSARRTERLTAAAAAPAAAAASASGGCSSSHLILAETTHCPAAACDSNDSDGGRHPRGATPGHASESRVIPAPAAAPAAAREMPPGRDGPGPRREGNGGSHDVRDR
jgi:hypothetical protein